ncbi:MAG TPA: alpha/beta fold hydrolase [Thermoanaerobaculia bacterium]
MNARGLVLDPAALRMRAVRGVFRTLSAVSPAIAARAASRVWFTPPRPPVPQHARDLLATGERRDFVVHGRRVASWSWGSGPIVVFVHGWGGSAAQVQSFLEPLLKSGHRVITFDAPAHGASGASRFGKRQSTFFDFADAMIEITRDAGELAGVIAHSGGCTAVAWAIRSGWRVPAAVFVAPMGSPLAYRAIFQSALGVSDDVMNRFASRTEERLQFKWEELEVPGVADVAPTPRLLVVHDREDRETSWQEGAAVVDAWPNARLMTTTGLGHRRVLRDAKVVEEVVTFLA